MDVTEGGHWLEPKEDLRLHKNQDFELFLPPEIFDIAWADRNPTTVFSAENEKLLQRDKEHEKQTCNFPKNIPFQTFRSKNASEAVTISGFVADLG